MSEAKPGKRETRPSPAGARVLIALQGAEPAPELLAAASALARGLHAELAGLFVEDIALLRMAALPFTREVGVTSGVSRPIEVQDLERALRLQAERMRVSLARMAAELALPWSFQVTRGRLLEQVLEALASMDLIVVGRPRRMPGRALGPAEQPRPAEVSALFDATEAGYRALAAALELAEGRPEELSLLVPVGAHRDWRALRERAAEAMHVSPGAARLQPISSPEAGELSQQARRRRCRALVLSIRSLPDAQRQIRMLLEVADCPVVLVR
jgi:predicted phosphoribosyltransferase